MPKPNSSDEVSYQIQLIQVKINCLFLLSIIMIYFVTSVSDQKPKLKYQSNILSSFTSFKLSDQKQLFHILNIVQCPSFGPIPDLKKVNK